MLTNIVNMEMTIEHLSNILEQIDPESWMQFNGNVIKWGKYFIKIEYVDSVAEDFYSSTIKVLDIIEE